MAKYYAINVYMYVLFPVLVLFLMRLSSGALNSHNTLTNCNEVENVKIQTYTGNLMQKTKKMKILEVHGIYMLFITADSAHNGWIGCDLRRAVSKFHVCQWIFKIFPLLCIIHCLCKDFIMVYFIAIHKGMLTVPSSVLVICLI